VIVPSLLFEGHPVGAAADAQIDRLDDAAASIHYGDRGRRGCEEEVPRRIEGDAVRLNRGERARRGPCRRDERDSIRVVLVHQVACLGVRLDAEEPAVALAEWRADRSAGRWVELLRAVRVRPQPAIGGIGESEPN
jgi:hypothetical protein